MAVTHKATILRMFFISVVGIMLTCITGCNSSKVASRNLKRELRAVWIATFDHMDFPKNQGAPPQTHKKELIDLLNFHQGNGINAIFFQVRPTADAFYKSNIEPWSQWFTGKQGQSPDPAWDPLKFLVKECHERNMEIHAWINPYRAVYNVKWDETQENHITRRKPDWFVVYGKHKQFNPGLPEVRKYLTGVVADIASRYDIDGIHFDDYFYPYKKGKQKFPDQATYLKYKGKQPDIHHWRRDNVNRLIKRVHDTLQNIKPYVKFGVSPLGVWRNKKDDPEGSDTQVGQSSYDFLYADVLKWLREGWIDYLAPQLYWSIEHPRASFAKLVAWWAKHAYKRHIYIGHAFYKIGNDKDTHWKKASELPNQVRMSRKFRDILGNVYFRSSFLQKNPAKITDTLRKRLYKRPALIPRMPWKNYVPPNEPRDAFVIRDKDKISIRWKGPRPAIDGDTATYYVIYRFPVKAPLDYANPAYIRKLVRKKNFEESATNYNNKYRYAVSAVDRYHNEGQPVLLK